MAGFFEKLQRWLAGPAGARVCPGAAPAWQVEQRPGCRVYSGFYAVHDGSGRLIARVAGRVVERPGLPAEVFVRDPPEQLRRHPKGHCLQLAEPGGAWFKVHWERPARDADAGRAYAEQFLAEAVLGR
jgi:hypothetical protein